MANKHRAARLRPSNTVDKYTDVNLLCKGQILRLKMQFLVGFRSLNKLEMQLNIKANSDNIQTSNIERLSECLR